MWYIFLTNGLENVFAWTHTDQFVYRYFREILRPENTIFQVLTEPNDPESFIRVNCSGLTAAPPVPTRNLSGRIGICIGRLPNPRRITSPHGPRYFCLLSLGHTRQFAFFSSSYQLNLPQQTDGIRWKYFFRSRFSRQAGVRVGRQFAPTNYTPRISWLISPTGLRHDCSLRSFNTVQAPRVQVKWIGFFFVVQKYRGVQDVYYFFFLSNG